MSLKDMLEKDFGIQKKEVKEELTPERVAADLPLLRQTISFWRMYPDLFVDYLCTLNPNNSFHFFYYQRVFLRAVMRHKYVYCVFPRAYSKSFLAVMCLMLKCILYPGCKIFVVSGAKNQSASILTEKVQEICKLIPALSNEIIWDTRGTSAKTTFSKDSAIYTFKNGSTLENVAANENTRGRRFQSGLMEEVIGIDQDMLNSVIIPTMNVERRVNGVVDPNEPLNQSQIYVTTAGFKNSFSYEKLIQILCQSIARPDQAIILGGSWRTPVVEGLLNKNFVRDLRLDGTYNEASFDREYESKWAGSVEGAFFDAEKFDKHRTIQLPDDEYDGRTSERSYYVMGVDVGRKGCTTEVVIMKVVPSKENKNVWTKKIVNFFSYDEEHFGLQSIHLKRLFKRYRCKVAVIDGNGLGIGLIDFLIQDQTDPDSGEMLGNFGVINDEDNFYRKYETENTIPNAMYVMKATNGINSELYAYTQSQLSTGKLLFLIDENTAKAKLSAQKDKASARQRQEYLKPYVMTSVLREQMANLVEDHDGMLIVLKQSTRAVKKDRFSALIYALWWPMNEEKKRKRTFKPMDLMFFTKH